MEKEKAQWVDDWKMMDFIDWEDDENEEWLDLFTDVPSYVSNVGPLSRADKLQWYIVPAQEFFDDHAYNVRVLDVRDSLKHPDETYEWLVVRD